MYYELFFIWRKNNFLFSEYFWSFESSNSEICNVIIDIRVHTYWKLYLFDYQSEICSQRVVYNYYQHILTPWIMAISKRCKPDNFDSLNSLKLNFKFCWKWIFMKVISYSIESMMKFFLIYIHFKQDLEKEKPAFSILHMLE